MSLQYTVYKLETWNFNKTRKHHFEISCKNLNYLHRIIWNGWVFSTCIFSPYFYTFLCMNFWDKSWFENLSVSWKSLWQDTEESFKISIMKYHFRAMILLVESMNFQTIFFSLKLGKRWPGWVGPVQTGSTQISFNH